MDRVDIGIKWSRSIATTCVVLRGNASIPRAVWLQPQLIDSLVRWSLFSLIDFAHFLPHTVIDDASLQPARGKQLCSMTDVCVCWRQWWWHGDSELILNTPISDTATSILGWMKRRLRTRSLDWNQITTFVVRMHSVDAFERLHTWTHNRYIDCNKLSMLWANEQRMRSIQFDFVRERQTRDKRRVPVGNNCCKTSLIIWANILTIEYRHMVIAMTSIDGASNYINWPHFQVSTFCCSVTKANEHHVWIATISDYSDRRLESEVTIEFWVLLYIYIYILNIYSL